MSRTKELSLRNLENALSRFTDSPLIHDDLEMENIHSATAVEDREILFAEGSRVRLDRLFADGKLNKATEMG